LLKSTGEIHRRYSLPQTVYVEMGAEILDQRVEAAKPCAVPCTYFLENDTQRTLAQGRWRFRPDPQQIRLA
jgi:hypothetical protein